MSALNSTGIPRALTRRARHDLQVLQSRVRGLGTDRATALRLLWASRHATTAVTQHEFWLGFSWTDLEYRAAVRELARFCSRHAPRIDRDAA